MVSLQTVHQSNTGVANLPKGLIVLFIGATSGIGQSALQHFVQHASSPHIYTVARPSAVASHETFLSSLRQSNTAGTFNLITADVSLVAEIDKIVSDMTQKETKLDILFMSPGFMAFEGRKDTREGLDPSMTTRYYSRLRAVQQLLPLRKNAPSPRIVSVLGGGIEPPINEHDLDLREAANWSVWNATWHTATMGTLALEWLTHENPRLSIVHWLPGPVATPGLAKAKKYGMSPPNQMSVDEAGARALFLATNDRYAVQGGGLVPVPEGLSEAKKSGGGIFLINPQCESTDNERRLSDMRRRGVDEKVWNFTQEIFAACESEASSFKDEL
jgi:NAD(P)-dependent dehydrogenase (short-subunit alcohol dehydrogenase family)